MSEPEGTVVAVCLRAEGGVPKQVQPQIKIGPHGVEGDYHSGEITMHGSRAGEPNLRHVSIVSEEAVQDAAESLGVTIPQGGLGENILVRGLGDLGTVAPGQWLRFSSGVELEVTAQNNPCKNLSVYHPKTPKQLYGRRGLLAVVKTPGALKPGDKVTLG